MEHKFNIKLHIYIADSEDEDGNEQLTQDYTFNLDELIPNLADTIISDLGDEIKKRQNLIAITMFREMISPENDIMAPVRALINKEVADYIKKITETEIKTAIGRLINSTWLETKVRTSALDILETIIGRIK